MARKNVVSISTNLTPEQNEVIERLTKTLDVNQAHLIRMALAQFVERNNGEWPTAEIKRGAKSHTPNNGRVEN